MLSSHSQRSVLFLLGWSLDIGLNTNHISMFGNHHTSLHLTGAGMNQKDLHPESTVSRNNDTY